MATSGVYSFNQTRDEIILDTLIGMNVLGGNETSVPAEELSYASRVLNRIITSWNAGDLPLWLRKEAVLFPQYAQNKYDVGPTSTDIIAAEYVTTTTTAAASSAATAIAVTSATGMSAAQDIGIELDTGYLQWTTISSIASLTINLDDALTSAVESEARVYVCTAGIQRPLRILDMRCFDVANDQDIVMNQLNYVPYMHQSQKTLQNSLATQYMYNPALDNGELYLFPTPSDMNKVLKFTYHSPIQNFNSSTDNADFPVQWLNAIMAELAYQLAPKYGMYIESGELKARSEREYLLARKSNHEQGNIEVKMMVR